MFFWCIKHWVFQVCSSLKLLPAIRQILLLLVFLVWRAILTDQSLSFPGWVGLHCKPAKRIPVASFCPSSLGRQPSCAVLVSPKTYGNRELSKLKTGNGIKHSTVAFWLFQSLNCWQMWTNCFLPLFPSACRKWEILKQDYSMKLICQRTSGDLKQISILCVWAFTLKWLLMQLRCYDCFKELLHLSAYVIYFIDIIV